MGAADADASGDGPGTAGTATHCPYCALQCGMWLTPATEGTPSGGAGAASGRAPDGAASDGGPPDGGPPARDPDADPLTVAPRATPTSPQGGLCRKGWTAPAVLVRSRRLTEPLARPHRGAPLRPVSWDEALDRVADHLARTRREHGADAVGVLGGGGLTNEKAYTLGKFARVVLGTSQIDYNGRFCMSSAAAAGNRAFGLDRGLPFPLTDLADADAVLLAGSNLAETMPPVVGLVDRMRGRGGALVVVDPRRTPTARLATLHLQPTPGTDLALYLGLLHLALVDGHADEAYLAARTTGLAAVRRAAMRWWPERVERVTGVPVSAMAEAVRLLAGAERALVLSGRGSEQHANGTDTVSALINLALVLGLPGRPGSGYGCLTGQGNGQGGREHGQKADQLPGYRRIDDPAARAHVAGVWGVDPASLPGPGRSAYEMLDTLGTPGGVRDLLVFGTNVVVSAPHAGHVTERLAALDLLVVADVVLSETAEVADVVLPVAQWAEEDGTTTNLEGRVIRRRRAMSPPDGVRTDLAVLADLVARLGHRLLAEPRAVFDELARASAGGPADYAGMDYARLDAHDGLFWPCPAPGHPGSPRLFLDRFATPDGRARFVPVDHVAVAEPVDDDHPVYATTGRLLSQYQSGAQTRRVPELRDADPTVPCELHPDLAATIGVADGDPVRVVGRRGTVRAIARLSDALRPDTVFLPFHYAGAGRANLLTDPRLDPVSRMPQFKVAAVRVEADTDGEAPA